LAKVEGHEDVVDSKRPARTSRVTFNIPEPVEYVERPGANVIKHFAAVFY
jgi:hypothetical protein